MLACLQPEQLQELFVMSTAAQLVEALPHFSGLHSLTLGTLSRDLPDGMAAALSQLPRLRSLNLSSTSGLPLAQLVAAIALRTNLSKLVLRAAHAEQPWELRHLTCLHQLSSLQLSALSEDTCIRAPEPALLPALKEFKFETLCSEPSDGAGVQVRSRVALPFCSPIAARLQPERAGGIASSNGLHCSAALTKPFRFQCQVAAYAMKSCSCFDRNSLEARLVGGNTEQLSIAALAPAGSLPQLLSVLRPGNVQAILGLQLLGSHGPWDLYPALGSNSARLFIRQRRRQLRCSGASPGGPSPAAAQPALCGLL